MRSLFRLLAAAPLAVAAAHTAIAASTAVEYFHAGYGHYFLTASPREIAALDAGLLAGWSRTGESFGVLDIGTAGSAAVYRFWSGQTFAPKSSHFLTAHAPEAAALRANPDWTYEGEAFAVAPSDAAGDCRGGLLPLYRLYNNGLSGAPNHRYTTKPAVREQMRADGWIAEGAGAGVIGCVTASGTPLVIDGRVIDGGVARALVCADVDRNGRCDASEAQAYTDASGAFHLAIPEGTGGPLVAEMLAVSRPARPRR
jgi:hypothetical protein